MKRLSKFLILGIFSISFHAAVAQFYFYNNRYYDRDFLFEAGLSVGLMNALTDLGEDHLSLNNNQLCAGLYGLTQYRGIASLRLQFTKGNVRANDNILRNRNIPPTGRFERNLSFESSIYELALLLQIYPLAAFGRNEKPPLLSPYFNFGAGVFHFNPIAVLDGNKYSLHSFHTEGQGFAEYHDRKNYQLAQSNLVFGAGLRVEISPKLAARADFQYRILHTDYLDDVSKNYIEPKLFRNYLSADAAAIAYRLADRRGELDPTHEPVAGDRRGNPGRNDGYMSVELKLGFIFGREKIR